MKCLVCEEKKGKRACRLHDGRQVCPLCCATLRTAEQCGDCPHFKKAEEYRKERVRQGQRPDFIMRVDEAVENETDRALEQIEQGRLVEAERSIRKLYQENADLCCTQYAMGVVHLSKEEPEQAAEYFQQAVRTYPYFSEAFFNLSACYRQMMEIEKALRCLLEARDVAKRGSSVHIRTSGMLREFEETIRQHEGVNLERYLEAGDAFNRGVENMEKSDFRKAIIDFQESLRIKPNAPQAYGNLGICFGKLGKTEQALAMFDRALEIDPNYEPAKWNRANIERMAEGETDVAVTSIQYGAARLLEDKERTRGRAGTQDGPATALLNSLRRQGERQ